MKDQERLLFDLSGCLDLNSGSLKTGFHIGRELKKRVSLRLSDHTFNFIELLRHEPVAFDFRTHDQLHRLF